MTDLGKKILAKVAHDKRFWAIFENVTFKVYNTVGHVWKKVLVIIRSHSHERQVWRELIVPSVTHI